MTTDFDPTAPLPAPPSPWTGSSQPSGRNRPPFHMTDMIAAEPHLARRLLVKLMARDSEAVRLADAVREALDADRAVVATGCGTSEHGALAIVELLREATGAGTRVAAEQAFELALAPPRDALVIGVSHEGGSAATNRALEAARNAGSRTALVTAGGESPGAALADILVTTDEMDQSWCHTIGYVAPILVGAAVVGHLTGRPPDPAVAAGLLEAGAADGSAAEAIAAGLADAAHLLAIGSGADRVAGRELVLKVEEATWVPSAWRDLETFLHGHLPATGAGTGVVLLLTDRRDLADRVARARQALRAIGRVGARTGAILSSTAAEAIDPSLTPAGRIVVPDDERLAASAASLLASATGLQLLTERLARARGTNPDPIRRDDPVYREASAIAES